MELTPALERELTSLSHRYASAADDRRFDTMALLFVEDGELVTPTGARSGRRSIEEALNRLSRYDATFHMLGQIVIRVERDEYVGETYSIAHHFTSCGKGDGDDRVLYLRYHDRFGIAASGSWAFVRRRLEIVWEASS